MMSCTVTLATWPVAPTAMHCSVVPFKSRPTSLIVRPTLASTLHPGGNVVGSLDRGSGFNDVWLANITTHRWLASITVFFAVTLSLVTHVMMPVAPRGMHGSTCGGVRITEFQQQQYVFIYTIETNCCGKNEA